MKALIDGDVLLYRVGFVSNDTSERNAIARLRASVYGILEKTGCEDYEIFLSDTLENNFRSEICREYKANRTAPKPIHFEPMSNSFVEDFKATICYGMEADDGLGISATALGDQSIIVSIDKDLLQISGEHFNYVTETWRTITATEGRFRFYRQILTGDPTDNITSKVGLSAPAIGLIRANRILESCDDTEHYNKVIWEAFNERLKGVPKEDIHKRIEKTGQLVKIRTQPDELWRYEYEYGS